MATEPKFLPGFIPAVSKLPRQADYTAMQFQGQSTNQNGQSIYKFDINPYDSSDVQTRTADNALAPRHTHFEYSVKDSPTAS